MSSILREDNRHIVGPTKGSIIESLHICHNVSRMLVISHCQTAFEKRLNSARSPPCHRICTPTTALAHLLVQSSEELSTAPGNLRQPAKLELLLCLYLGGFLLAKDGGQIKHLVCDFAHLNLFSTLGYAVATVVAINVLKRFMARVPDSAVDLLVPA